MRGILTIGLLLLILSACEKQKEFIPEFDVVVLLPVEGLGDRSFADRVYEGTEYAIQGTAGRVTYMTPESLEAGQDWVKHIADLEFSTSAPALIVIAGAQYSEAIEEIEGNFDPHKVVFFGQTETKHPSLAVMDFRTYAPSYIGGYLSTQLTQETKAVIIAGMDAAFLKDYEKGFTQGVLDAGGTMGAPIYLSKDFSGFEMPDSAYSITQSILDEYELVFALSAGSNFGIINACRDYQEQRYAIGVDADQSWMGKTVVTGSVVKDFGVILKEYIDGFEKEQFTSGNFTESLESGSTDFLINSLIINPEEKTRELINIAIEKENHN